MEIKAPKLPKGNIGRIALAAVVLLCIAAVLFLSQIAESFAPIRRCFSVLSPDGTHIAAVECWDQGALGGRTYVYIRNREKNSSHPKSSGGRKIADVGHLYPDDVKIQWINNEALQFNGTTYKIH